MAIIGNIPYFQTTQIARASFFLDLHLHPPCNWRPSHSGNCTMLKSLGVVRTCLAPMTSLGRKAVLENVTSFEQTAEPPEKPCLLRILREWYRKHWWKLQQATRQLSWKTIRAVEHFCPDLDSAEIYNTSESFRVYVDGHVNYTQVRRCPSPCNLCETATVCTECAESSYLTHTGTVHWHLF